jgi:Sec-independent protein translocase protein TatA
MNVFGIGLPEILFILFLSLLIFGPKDLQKTGKTIGRALNKLVRSENWRAIQQTTRELKSLPNRLMRESGVEEIKKSIGGELQNTTGNETAADLKKDKGQEQ